MVKLIGRATSLGKKPIQLSGRSLPAVALPLPGGLSPVRVLVSYLHVSNPWCRAFTIWLMVGRVLLKASQRSAASVREML